MKELLKQYAAITKRIAECEEVTKAMEAMAKDLRSQSLEQEASNMDDNIADVRREITELRASLPIPEVDMQRIHGGIRDPLISLYFKLHYMNGMSWPEIAAMTNQTAAGVLRATQRALASAGVEGD